MHNNGACKYMMNTHGMVSINMYEANVHVHYASGRKSVNDQRYEAEAKESQLANIKSRCRVVANEVRL